MLNKNVSTTYEIVMLFYIKERGRPNDWWPHCHVTKSPKKSLRNGQGDIFLILKVKMCMLCSIEVREGLSNVPISSAG